MKIKSTEHCLKQMWTNEQYEIVLSFRLFSHDNEV